MTLAALGPVGDSIDAFLSSTIFDIGGFVLTVGQVARVIAFVLLIAVVSRVMSRVVVPRLLRRGDEGVVHAAARITTYVVWTVGALVGLPMVGIPINNVMLAFSALGVGLGFGLQNIANNFVSGLILLVERPVKVGDRVKAGDLYGTITQINARATIVETNENLSVVVPNSEFVSQSVTNFSLNGPMVRFRFAVGVSYGSDVELVRQTLLDVAKANPHILDDPAPEVLFMEFGNSSLDFVLRAATVSMTRTPDVLISQVNFEIWHAFEKQGIEIPFPQRDLHLKTVSPAAREAIVAAS